MENIAAKNPKAILTGYLIIAIIANGCGVPLYALFQDTIRAKFPPFEPREAYFLAALACANVVFYAAILKWKKWGFWGVCAIAVVAFLPNALEKRWIAALGLLGPVFLYALLQYGKERKAWPQLT